MAVEKLFKNTSFGFDFNFNYISQYNELIMLITLLAAITFFVVRLLQHKRLVKIYEKVQDGYVTYSGRYSYSKDKSTNLEYLRPIFGKNRLPWFDLDKWQKIKGLPIFGVNRVIHLVKVNDYTFVPIVPNLNTEQVELVPSNAMAWVFLNEQARFMQDKNKKDLSHVLSIIAPSIVIIATLGFIGFVIILQIKLNNFSAEKITESTNIIINYITNGGLK